MYSKSYLVLILKEVMIFTGRIYQNETVNIQINHCYYNKKSMWIN